MLCFCDVVVSVGAPLGGSVSFNYAALRGCLSVDVLLFVDMIKKMD